MKFDTKHCFTPHIIYHSIAGLGVGLILTALVPWFSNVLVGVVLIIAAIVLDATRKHIS